MNFTSFFIFQVHFHFTSFIITIHKVIMPRTGTLVVCVQNLDCSGANQIILNILNGRMHESNIIVLAPAKGPFGSRFLDSGAAVRIGEIRNLLTEIRDIVCVICNTIMTAPIVVEMSIRFAILKSFYQVHKPIKQHLPSYMDPSRVVG